MNAETEAFSSRLSESRRRAGFASPREAANAFGWNENTYKSREGAVRGIPDQEEVRKYARAYGVSFIWLLTGEGEERERNLVQVVGKIGAGAAIAPSIEQVPSSGLYEIETLIPLPEGTIAFEIEGDSMWPRYDPGDVVICWRDGSPIEEVVGWEGAVRTDDDRRYLKRVLKGSAPDRYDLESHNAPPIRGARLKWVSKVHSIIRADMWKKANTPKARKTVERRIAKAG